MLTRHTRQPAATTHCYYCPFRILILRAPGRTHLVDDMTPSHPYAMLDVRDDLHLAFPVWTVVSAGDRDETD